MSYVAFFDSNDTHLHLPVPRRLNQRRQDPCPQTATTRCALFLRELGRFVARPPHRGVAPSSQHQFDRGTGWYPRYRSLGMDKSLQKVITFRLPRPSNLNCGIAPSSPPPLFCKPPELLGHLSTARMIANLNNERPVCFLIAVLRVSNLCKHDHLNAKQYAPE